MATKSKKSTSLKDQSGKSTKQEKKKPRNTKKNISLPVSLQKIVDVVVEPIKKISKRRQQRKEIEVDVPFAESSSCSELTTSMKFFYSNDRFIDTFDDMHIYEQLCKHYPALHAEQKNMQHKRHAILDLLQDQQLISNLKEQYNMDIFDIIKFLFRLCPSLFKGIFVKKIQNTIKNQPYAKKLKKHEYKIAKLHVKSAYRRNRSF